MPLKLLHAINAHDGPVWCVAWSKNNHIATCGVDRTVKVWEKKWCNGDGNEWKCIAKSHKFRRTVRKIAWGSDNRSIAVACFDGVATILELTKGGLGAGGDGGGGGRKTCGGEGGGGCNAPGCGALSEAAIEAKAEVDVDGGCAFEYTLEPAVTLEGHESEVKGVAYSGSGGLLATCSRDRSIWIWEVGAEFEYECIALLLGHSADVKAVAWHPNVEIMISCGYDSVAKVWAEDEDDWFCTETLAAHQDTVWNASFDKFGTRLATCSADKSLILWHLVGGEPKFAVVARVENLHDGAVYSCAFSSDANRIVTSGADDTICVLQRHEVQDNEASLKSSTKDHVEIIAKFKQAHRGDVNCVEWMPNSNEIIASCGDDGMLKIWSVEHMQEDLSKEQDIPAP